MGFIYADSSVLVKRHVIETGTAWFQKYAQENTVITTQISFVEVFSAFNRLLREERIEREMYETLATDFTELCEIEYTLIELTNDVLQGARKLLEKYPLRAYDAVQLISAVMANDAALQSAQIPIVFLSADYRLLDAAKQESLMVDTPPSG